MGNETVGFSWRHGLRAIAQILAFVGVAGGLRYVGGPLVEDRPRWFTLALSLYLCFRVVWALLLRRFWGEFIIRLPRSFPEKDLPPEGPRRVLVTEFMFLLLFLLPFVMAAQLPGAAYREFFGLPLITAFLVHGVLTRKASPRQTDWLAKWREYRQVPALDASPDAESNRSSRRDRRRGRKAEVARE